MSDVRFSAKFNNAAKDNKIKKSGGRPRKNEKDRRKKSVTSSYTNAEYHHLLAQTKKANLTPSIFQREASIHAKVNAIDTSAGLRIALLQKIVSQLRRATADIHKLERHHVAIDGASHLSGRPIDTQKMLERINELLAVITLILRREAGL